MEDAQIVQLYFNRDEQAVLQTEKKYGKSLLLLSKRIVINDEDSQECVNDTYLRAWNTIPPTKPKHLSAYLYAIIRSISIDRFRAKKSAKRAMNEYILSLDELAECIAGEETPQDALEMQMLVGTIEAFMKGLPKEQRQIFLCRYYFMDSIKAISGYLCMSESKIKSTLYRVRCELKKILQQEGYFL